VLSTAGLKSSSGSRRKRQTSPCKGRTSNHTAGHPCDFLPQTGGEARGKSNLREILVNVTKDKEKLRNYYRLKEKTKKT
jgi:hypothetical protein